ncbi:hypothetical protein FACS189429_0910 [Bacteroidia bacterium]|nr:hypothetical protein FACS189429_0910 [Bacteroidia bacterium]
MKHLKLIALFLSIALSTQLKAAEINQHFSPGFGAGWYQNAPITDADGWSYLMLKGETDSQHIYYGDASVSLQTYNWETDPEAYLITPVKVGGVGWITFRYKTYEASTWNTGTITLEIQTSETGVAGDFTTVGTVTTLQETAIWNRYSGVINDANAKYVRLLLKKGTSASMMDIDELVVTDAVSGGTPATIDAAFTADIESVVGETVTIANAITLSGTNVTGNVALSFVASPSVFSVSPASVTGAEVNAGTGLTVEFTPAVKNITSDYLKISGGNLPETFIKVSGLGLSTSIAEDFNTPINAYGNFDYYGWTLSDANYATTQWGPDINVYEGYGAVNFATLISPKKAGGIGEISFMYRGYNSYTPDFEVFVSSDKSTWTKVGETITASSTYTLFHAQVNSATAKYVKVAAISSKLDADLFIITENGVVIPSAIGTATSTSGVTAPYDFTVPVTFANISGDLTLSINEPQLVLGNTTLTQTEAIGTVNLPITFTPAEGKAFAQGTITITGGGLPFPATVIATAYLEVEQLSVDFESDWSTSTMNQIVEGWNVTNGSKSAGSAEYPNGALSSPAAAYIQTGSSIISPPKSGGVGTVQFYSKVGWGTGTLSLSTSIDGTTWTTFDQASAIALTSDWKKFEYVINDAAAKYVKINCIDGSPYIDNITVTKNGVGIANYQLLNTPVFMTASGTPQTVQLQLQGANISSDIQVALKSGTVFTLANTTISPNDINGQIYELAVTFDAESGTYHQDELTLSGGGFLFDETIPLKGYILQDLIYQDFEGTIEHGTDYNSMNIDGWEAYAGTTSGTTAYEGTSIELQPASGNVIESYLLTVPKSGGVGEISFYYKNGSDDTWGYGIPVTFRIQTYTELEGTPTVILQDTVIAPTASADEPYQKFNRIVNDPNAKYVEVFCPKPDGTSGTLRIDNFAVTAVGKRVPEATAPSAIRMAAYPGETDTYTFDFAVVGVDQDIHLSMKNGSAVSVDKTAITPVDGQVTETITLTYDADGITFSADTLVIESAGLLKSLVIPVLATTYQDVLVQDFNKESWYREYDATDILDGWLIIDGRNTIENWGETPLEGTKSLRLSSSNAVASSITSPAKSGGINKVEFYWRLQSSSSGEITVDIQTSTDGETWQTVDQLTTGTTTEFTGYHLYEKVVGDKEAQYLRLQASRGASYRPSYLWIDSIAITPMPYLRNSGEIQEIETTLSVCPVGVQVAGLLTGNASISLAGDTDNFILATTSISPNALENGAKAPVNLLFLANEAESGEYEALIDLTYDINDTETATLTIPVLVKYTKPYIELVSAEGPETTTSGTATITVQVKGVLNTDATIALVRGTEFALTKTSLTNAELAGETTVSFDVNFVASTFGTFFDVILIRNNDIETLAIPISIENKNEETGLDKISGGNVSVYAGENGILNIVGAPAGSKVTVFDIQGKAIFNTIVKSDNEQYDVLTKGIYIVKVGEKTWKVLR